MPMTFAPYEVPSAISIWEMDLTRAPICLRRFNRSARFSIALSRFLCPPCNPPRPADVPTPKTCIFFAVFTPTLRKRWEITLAIVTLEAVTCSLVFETGKLHPISKALMRPFAALTAMSRTFSGLSGDHDCRVVDIDLRRTGLDG